MEIRANKIGTVRFGSGRYHGIKTAGTEMGPPTDMLSPVADLREHLTQLAEFLDKTKPKYLEQKVEERAELILKELLSPQHLGIVDQWMNRIERGVHLVGIDLGTLGDNRLVIINSRRQNEVDPKKQRRINLRQINDYARSRDSSWRNIEISQLKPAPEVPVN